MNTGPRLLGVVAVSLAASACAGISPGDYVVYRVGYASTAFESDCYGGDDPPPEVVDDESTFFGGTTFAMFRGLDDAFYLDTASIMLAGTKESGDYIFRGRSADVYYSGEDRYEDRNDVTIRLTDKGDAVEGSSTNILEQICSGINCAVGYDGTCTTRANFVGTRIKDAEVQYVITAD